MTTTMAQEVPVAPAKEAAALVVGALAEAAPEATAQVRAVWEAAAPVARLPALVAARRVALRRRAGLQVQQAKLVKVARPKAAQRVAPERLLVVVVCQT
jgi:hypothetical protein